MENIYDIRIKENMLYILNENLSSNTVADEILESAAIAVNLYYEDDLDRYFSYLCNINEKIKIYVISSKQIILDKANDYFKGKNNIELLKKDNRGRDISALLVEFRKISSRYKYICFVHDKKARYAYAEEDVEFWIRNLWENTIGSETYINNVLDTFEKNDEIGLLVPPEPIGEYTGAWFLNTWSKDYDITQNLADEMQLQCDLDREKPPITIGTVFWAKTCCLKKLLEKEWKYEDFPKEPLPADGTISHAIERILGYVAQDAGYKTGTIMSNGYAQSMMLFVQKAMSDMGGFLENEFGIRSIRQVRQYERQKECITDFFARNSKVFLYGAGEYGKSLLDTIRTYGLEPDGFVITKGEKGHYVNGLLVYEICDIEPADDTGIILAVHYEHQEELINNLDKYGHSNYIPGYL